MLVEKGNSMLRKARSDGGVGTEQGSRCVRKRQDIFARGFEGVGDVSARLKREASYFGGRTGRTIC